MWMIRRGRGPRVGPGLPEPGRALAGAEEDAERFAESVRGGQHRDDGLAGADRGLECRLVAEGAHGGAIDPPRERAPRERNAVESGSGASVVEVRGEGPEETVGLH